MLTPGRISQYKNQLDNELHEVKEGLGTVRPGSARKATLELRLRPHRSGADAYRTGILRSMQRLRRTP